MDGKPELSLIMPAYNEEDTIEEVVARVDRILNGTKLSYELIVVDDGSSDGTRMRALNHTQKNINSKVIGYNVLKFCGL